MFVCVRACMRSRPCVHAWNVNEVCAICIFKLVGQGGGEKVTGNEMCLTAVMLLMRVSPRSTPNGMKMAGESKISWALKFNLSNLWPWLIVTWCADIVNGASVAGFSSNKRGGRRLQMQFGPSNKHFC